MKNKLLILLLLISAQSWGQTFSVTGSVINSETEEPLSFANIRVLSTNNGTAANAEGVYQLKLQKGKYKIAASFIGFISDTAEVELQKNETVNFKLVPTSIELSEVKITPGVNPAIAIVEKAIAAKHKRDKALRSYIFKAYTKGHVKTTKDISAGNNNVGVSIGEKDTAKLKITGLLENESVGYFKKPDYRKDIIVAQKQSSNFPSTINVVTGGRLIQNFYSESIRLFNKPLPSPISDGALNYYYYYIEDSLKQDDKKIYKLYFAPDDEDDPGFYGNIYIVDKTFDLAKAVVFINAAANPGGIFNTVKIFQQYSPFDGIYMPIDFRIFADGDFIGLAKFGFGLNSIMYDYQINPEIPDDFFDEVIIKVLPDASKKDSLYWKSILTIPNTLEEIEAYKRIDSLEAVPKSFWDNFSVLAMRIKFSENLSVSGPLWIYYFNRVSGHSFDFKIYGRNFFDKRLYGTAHLGYGFNDKKFKGELKSYLLLGEYRTTRVDIDFYNTMRVLFEESDNYNILTSTVTNLVNKYDFRDYYYSKGFRLGIKGEVFPVLNLGVAYGNRTDNNAYVTTDFSIFNRDKVYRENPEIFETKIASVSVNFKLDFRKFIEDGYFRRRIGRGGYYPIITGEITHSDGKLLGSNYDFTSFVGNVKWFIPTFNSAGLSVKVKAVYSDGPVPYQMMFALPGNIAWGGKTNSFRTLWFGDVFGDRVAAINIEHRFNDELFRLLKIPFVKDWRLRFNVHFNVAWLDVSEKSLAIMPREPELFKKPFFELGFGIGQMFLPMTFEFTWKLNHFGKNDFVFGINTFAL